MSATIPPSPWWCAAHLSALRGGCLSPQRRGDRTSIPDQSATREGIDPGPGRDAYDFGRPIHVESHKRGVRGGGQIGTSKVTSRGMTGAGQIGMAPERAGDGTLRRGGASAYGPGGGRVTWTPRL